MSHFNRLYALVQEIEANTTRLDQAHERASGQVVHRDIPGYLGTITVGAGGPVAVDLDKRAVRYTNGAALGAAVLQAITAAEAELRDRYQQIMADARRDITA